MAHPTLLLVAAALAVAATSTPSASLPAPAVATSTPAPPPAPAVAVSTPAPPPAPAVAATVRGAPDLVVAPAGAWGWPLRPGPAVARGFRAPPTPWGPGHRGVDLVAAVAQPVLAAGAGVVSFSGVVAGRGVVTVTHRGGLRTSYEPVDARVPRGMRVRAGDPLGVLSAGPGHCAPATCLHWGLRRGATYLDPLLLLRPHGPPVLVPLEP